MQDRVLIIDDDQAVRSSLRRYLQKCGFAVDEADSCRTAEARFRAFAPRVALIDYRLPDGEALTLLPRLRHIDPSCTFFVLTGYGTIDLAVRAVKEGATEFLIKPVDMLVLLRAVQIGVRASKSGANRTSIVEPFFGESEPMQALRARLQSLAASEGPTLFVGEEGTGRCTLARWLHATSGRAGAHFVALDCAADGAERDLFGFEERGAASRPGVIEATEGGTLFLEHIGDAPPSFQHRILDLLSFRSFQRVGSTERRVANVRVAASSEAALELAPEASPIAIDPELRTWFAPRTLVVPPLRARGEDIVSLARHLVFRLSARHGRGALELTDEAERELRTYVWPGNVRELENVLESAILLGSGPTIDAAELRLERRPSGTERLTLEALERRTIRDVLRDENGKVEAAARRLGIPRSTLYYKLKMMGLTARAAAQAKRRSAPAPRRGSSSKTQD